ncbi:MAG: glycosyltransferase family 2 protein [bacterium]|nr:glycosyltransferase family 2 protein [bacterium]
MKISIIITAHNYGKYIGRAIRSALDQSLDRRDYEVIVVDDGSSDITPTILESFGEDIRVIRFPENKGLPAAVNEGIRKARSRYVVRLDADDFIHEDLLRVQYLYLSLNPEMDAVSCDYCLVDDRERTIERKNAEEHPIACGIMFRKDFLVEIGLYDENFLSAEEEDLRIRYLEKYNIFNIPLPLYRYRMHKNNMTNDTERMEYYKKKVKEKNGCLRRPSGGSEPFREKVPTPPKAFIKGD